MGDDMKRIISICLLFLLGITLCIIGAYFLQKKDQRNEQNSEKSITEEQQESYITSSIINDPCLYLLIEQDGKLVVLEKATNKEIFHTGIESGQLPLELKEALKYGISFYSEEELLEFLESYSS